MSDKPTETMTDSVDTAGSSPAGATASPAEIAALQAQLTAVGLLDPDSYAPGFVGGGNDPTR